MGKKKKYREETKQGWKTGRFDGERSRRNLTDKKTFEQRSKGGDVKVERKAREKVLETRECLSN